MPRVYLSVEKRARARSNTLSAPAPPAQKTKLGVRIVHARLEFIGCLEERHQLGRNLDTITRARIAGLARAALFHLEASEPAQLNLVAVREGATDVIDHLVDDDARVLLVESGDPRDLLDQVCFR